MAPPASRTRSEAVKEAPNPPSVLTMVREAVKFLNNRNGSSLYAVKQWIEENHPGLDLKSINSEINDCVKGCLEAGMLIQTSGKGINGSFKLPKTAGKPNGGKPRIDFSSSDSESESESEKVEESEEEEDVRPGKILVFKKFDILSGDFFYEEETVGADGTIEVARISKEEYTRKLGMLFDDLINR